MTAPLTDAQPRDRVAELESVLARLLEPKNNSIPIPMWAAGIVKTALDKGGQG